LLIPLGGCAGTRHVVHRLPEPPPGRAVVIVADGAGNFQGASIALRGLVEEENLPLHIHTFEWSHGNYRAISDLVDFKHTLRRGEELAELVMAQRRQQPDVPIILVGHSAGAGVVLCAAENLPPQSVDQIVLLLPAVSQDYDLRPTLRSIRKHLDVFHSAKDRWWLGLVPNVLGTTDRRWGVAAGRYGFRPVIECTADERLHRKLRQHGWHPCMAWTGNMGGHFGCYLPDHMRAYVLQWILE
jgi:pimeloyl-ACP methyl ester carboxylesterase